jgi:uncharacterized protein YceK
MRALAFVAIAIMSGCAAGQTRHCPELAFGSTLASAKMHLGARNAGIALHGDVDLRSDGVRIRYSFPEAVPRWLVCQYGGKPVEATPVSGPDAAGARELWIELDVAIDFCDLVVKRTAGRKTAQVACQRRQPPPPDMLGGKP